MINVFVAACSSSLLAVAHPWPGQEAESQPGFSSEEHQKRTLTCTPWHTLSVCVVCESKLRGSLCCVVTEKVIPKCVVCLRMAQPRAGFCCPRRLSAARGD